MKLALRILGLTIVVAGAAASLSSSSTRVLASHQAATAGLPTPLCGPHVPMCSTDGR